MAYMPLTQSNGGEYLVGEGKHNQLFQFEEGRSFFLPLEIPETIDSNAYQIKVHSRLYELDGEFT